MGRFLVCADQAVNTLTHQPLTWLGGDPDGQPVTYTVALGTSNPPSNAVTVTQAMYAPTLITDTMY